VGHQLVLTVRCRLCEKDVSRTDKQRENNSILKSMSGMIEIITIIIKRNYFEDVNMDNLLVIKKFNRRFWHTM